MERRKRAVEKEEGVRSEAIGQVPEVLSPETRVMSPEIFNESVFSIIFIPFFKRY